MVKEKERVAIRFLDNTKPDIQPPQVVSFSEVGFQETNRSIFATFDALGSLARYAANRVRTRELGKQIAVAKETLNVWAAEEKKKYRLEYLEHSKRVESEIAAIKEKMEMDLEKLLMEVRAETDSFKRSFEESLRTSDAYLKILIQAQEDLDSFGLYIKELEYDFRSTREYIKYCEMYRLTIGRITRIIEQMGV